MNISSHRKRCQPKLGKVWLSQPGSGLCKRQCSLKICVQPLGTQPCLGIIFREKGLQISDKKHNVYHYHYDIDVYFQENFWTDTKVSVNRVGTTLAPIAKSLDRYILYCDNVTAQTQDSFKSVIWCCIIYYYQEHRLVASCSCWICTTSKGIEAWLDNNQPFLGGQL